jgi:hypothetical protein
MWRVFLDENNNKFIPLEKRKKSNHKLVKKMLRIKCSHKKDHGYLQQQLIICSCKFIGYKRQDFFLFKKKILSKLHKVTIFTIMGNNSDLLPLQS